MIKPPYDISSSALSKAKQIRIALFDVDGVLTDGSLFYNASGECLKRFNVLDGQGIKLLQNHDIEVGIISAKQSESLTSRLNDLGIKHQLTGISNKLSAFQQLLKDENIPAQQACFTGDDVIDIAVMQECGVAFSVDNAHYSVKPIADWVTPMPGGHGAVRAICDVILYAKNAD